MTSPTPGSGPAEPSGSTPPGAPPSRPAAGGAAARPVDRALVRRLELFAVCVLLTALTLSTDPGRILGDTKIDLTVNPLGFLDRALHLWDAAYFGQVQNQAYGYLFPNGPFHALLVGAGMPEWLVQRVWAAALLCAAFLGVVRLAREFGIGSAHARIVAGLGYALAPRVLTLLSYNSAELQPTLLLPWILLPLVHGARSGRSPLRAAALSAVAFLCCGGTNAAAELAVLVVPLLYLLTRTPGPRRRRLLGYWLAAVGLVSMWWLVPLLLMGRYVFSFMPFTEDAATTTSVTTLVNVLRGTANWMGYVPAQGVTALPAGAELAAEPWLVAATALVAGLGLAGLLGRRTPERTFLLASLLTGTAVVAAGYTGDLTGPFAPAVRDALDGALAPFRNIHKFDALIRLPLALGLARLPAAAAAARAARPPHRPTGGATVPPPAAVRRYTAGLCAVAVLTTLTPAAGAGLAAPGGFEEVPVYWREATAWIDARGGTGMTMAVPGSARGEYLWGRPMDEPMQPLMESPWTNHQIIPWGSAGVSRLLHEIDQRLSSGRGSPGLADALARMGVTHLLVRNDLQRVGNNGGWPARVHQALADSPGIEYARGFGPVVGALDALPASAWFDQPYQAVEVYTVRGAAPRIGTVARDGALRVTGGPEALLALAEQGMLDGDRPVIIGDDPGGADVPAHDTVVTDTLRRREVLYSDVRRNVTATLTADEPLERGAPAPDIADPAWDRYTAVAVPGGVRSVTASSSAAGVRAAAAERDPGRLPFAALEVVAHEEVGHALTEPRDVTGLTAAFEEIPGEPPPARVTVVTDTGRRTVPVAPGPQPQEVAAPPGRTSELLLRVDALAWDAGRPARVGIAELAVPGLRATRSLDVPGAPDAGAVLLTGSVGSAPGCLAGSRVWACHPDLAIQGEDAAAIDRVVTLSAAAAERLDTVTGRVVAADPAVLERAANRAGGYPRVTSSSTSVDHPAALGRSAFDGDPATVWYPDPAEDAPSLRVELAERTELDTVRVGFPRADAMGAPVRVTLESTTAVRSGWLDGDGRLDFAPFSADEVLITFEPPPGQPLEVESVALPGVPELAAVADTGLAASCGSGPRLRVNGRSVPTRIVGDALQDALAGRPVRYESCGEVPLTEGRNRIAVDGTGTGAGRVGVESAALQAAAAGDPPPVRTAAVRSTELWTATERRVTVDARDAAYLVVNENFNEGWQATLPGRAEPLTPVRLDGWKQAWELPAGTSGTVTLRYTPDTPYRAALAAGGALALGVVVLAFARLRPLGASRARGPAQGRGTPGAVEAAGEGGPPDEGGLPSTSGLPRAAGRTAGRPTLAERLDRRGSVLPAARAARPRPALLVVPALLYGTWVAGAAGLAVVATVLAAGWRRARHRPARPGRDDTGSAVETGGRRALGRRTGRALRRTAHRAADVAARRWFAAALLTAAGLALAAGTALEVRVPDAPLGAALRGWVPQLLCVTALARALAALAAPEPAPPGLPRPADTGNGGRPSEAIREGSEEVRT
ncbi:alpha-(1-_3)-arabinofuranosyltransferase domain-containing protein [Marinitenerispora sediminis]|uniref:DUF3367 domain-containing protein n=1 Tax=Marinitenerispora sediminis TaxID=1931232 RepID=A0A368TAP0_9ACTN|nr:DUF3367 domain-containing protein [Marinitenerispora sediminis]